MLEDDSTPDEFLPRHSKHFSSQSSINYNAGMESITSMPLPHSNTSQCKEEYQDNLTIFLERYIDGYVNLATACIGLVLNIAGMYILLRRKGHKKMFNLLLAINLMLDTMYLLFQIVCSFTHESSATYVIPILAGMRSTFILSALMLIALAHSRYQAVTDPYKGRTLRLYWSVRRKQLLKYILPAICFTMCFVVCQCVVFSCLLSVSGNATTLAIVLSVGIVLDLVFMGIFPFVSLLYFTYHILKTLNQRSTFLDYVKPHNDSIKRRACNNGNVLEAQQQEINLNMRRCKNSKASKTLFLMIFIFLFLHPLRWVANVCFMINICLGEHNESDYLNPKCSNHPIWLQVLWSLSNTCTVINASINFLVYLCLNFSNVTSTVSFRKPLCLMSPSSPQKNEEIGSKKTDVERIVSKVEVHADNIYSRTVVTELINDVNFVVIKAGAEWL